LRGQRPAYGSNWGSVEHQTLTVTMGSPESDLSANAVYDRVLDGYSLMQLELEYEAPIAVEPERPNAQAIFDQFCELPQDATIDKNTFDITPEVYGYGFNVENLQRQIDRAEYGQVIQITLDFLLPDITVNALNTNLFKDTLASYVSKCTDGTNTNRDKNLQLSCDAINGYVIKVGESFDFDDILGPRTTNRGYRNAPTYSGSTTSTIGGGINQTASVLYYCAMQAGLTINERHAHRYAVSYTPLGTDASITYGLESLVFTNNTSAPIRILATAEGSTVSITFLGTNDKDYTLKVQTIVKETFAPTTVYQYMDKDNIFGYVNGQVIQTSQTGYLIEVYLCKYDKKTGMLIERELLETARYDTRDRIVVKKIESGQEDMA
jgi:vancomycin resistance protein YoaR